VIAANSLTVNGAYPLLIGGGSGGSGDAIIDANIVIAGNLEVVGDAIVGGNLIAPNYIVDPSQLVGNLTNVEIDFIGNLVVSPEQIIGNLSNIEMIFVGGMTAEAITEGRLDSARLPLEPEITGNLTPSANVTYSLGNLTHRWKDLYLAGNTLYLGNAVISENGGGGIDLIGESKVRGNLTIETGGTFVGNGATITGLNASEIASGTIPMERISGISNFAVPGVVDAGRTPEQVVSTWTTRTSAADNNWTSVVWAPELGIFVAVAQSGSGNRVMTSPDGVSWTARTSASANNWRAVTWAPEIRLFVAVSQSGTGDRVMTSRDGIEWTSRTSAVDLSWRDVTWAPELSLFVAVAESGSGNRVMTSRDGIAWTARTSAADNQWTSVAWAPEIPMFVAVSRSGTGNRVMTSPDGITWTSRTSPATDNDWRSVTWSPELGLFAAVSSTGSGNRVMTSPDGITWTLRTSPTAPDNDWYSVIWASELGLFVAVSATGTGDRVMTSPDGINWAVRDTTGKDNEWIGVTWAPELGIFAAVSNSGTGDRVMTSARWSPLISRGPLAVGLTSADADPPATRGLDVARGGATIRGDFDVFSKGATRISGGGRYDGGSKGYGSSKPYFEIESLDAADVVRTWVTRTSAANNEWLSVTWAPELGIFVAVARTGTGNRVMTSPDGIYWTARTSAEDIQWFSVVWAAELGIFVAVSNTGTGDRVMTSPDGINWISRTSASDNSWLSVTWAPQLGLFVAVAQTGTGDRVMTSPDGITWTSRTSAADIGWRSVIWAPELGIFVAVANTGIGNRVMTSPDGINWTLQVSAADNDWRSVTWASELGIFCAVAISGTGDRVMTSPDGINWTARTSAADNQWQSVTWAPELGIFVAVALTGTGDRVMTSPDGINWTSRASAADDQWFGVTWAPELGIFVAVSTTATGNRVMTTANPASSTTIRGGRLGIGKNAANVNASLDVVGEIRGSYLRSGGDGRVAIGRGAGETSQGSCAVAVGSSAGHTSQGLRAVAIGAISGQINQGNVAVALGRAAGGQTQGVNAIAIGEAAGNQYQSPYAISIGTRAGETSQGSMAVAVGYFAGYSNQASNSIVINATGAVLNNTAADSCVISPMRTVNQNGSVLLRTSGGELYHGASGADASMSARLTITPGTAENVHGINTLLAKSDFTGTCVQTTAVRAANSGYEFLEAYSGNGADREFNLRGDGTGLCDGAWTGGGADYAEYFESASGDAIPVGTTVVLEGSKVRASTPSDSPSIIVGVVRPKGMAKGSVTIGNSAWNHWNKKYLTDDYGAYVMEPHEVLEWTDVKREYEPDKIPEGTVVPENATIETRERTETRTLEYLVWTDNAETGEEIAYPAGEVPEDVEVPGDVRTEFRTVEDHVPYHVISWTEAVAPTEDGPGERRSYESWNVPYDVTIPDIAVRKTHDEKGNAFVHKKPNPQYDPQAEYVPREDRPEWLVVGLLGQIPVTKGQIVGEKWMMMHEVSPSVDMWFVR
jgi:hypothetical protein